MDNTIYVGLSRQIVLQRALDVAANNIANVDTAGFKVEHLSVHTDPISPSVPGRQLGPVNYVLDTDVTRNFSEGELEQTGSAFDVAIQGEGFLTVQTPGGAGYTRDGHLTLDAQNQLVDKQGDPVLSTSGAPIVIDPTKPAPSIGKDGVVSQTGPNGQVAQIGKLGVVRFADRSTLSKSGGNVYTDTGGQTPQPAANTALSQGFLEKSNVQPVAEVNALISLSRAYERIQDIISSTQDTSSKAIDALGKLSS